MKSSLISTLLFAAFSGGLVGQAFAVNDSGNRAVGGAPVGSGSGGRLPINNEPQIRQPINPSKPGDVGGGISSPRSQPVPVGQEIPGIGRVGPRPSGTSPVPANRPPARFGPPAPIRKP